MKLGPGLRIKPGLVVLLALTALTLFPAAASAGTVSVSGTTVNFVAAPGETNSVDTFGFVDTFDVGVSDDLPIAIAPGSPCSYPYSGTTTVQCTMSSPASFNLQLGDGNDSGSIFAPPGTTNAIDGASGDDTLTMTAPASHNTLTGGAGNDVINPDTGSGGRPVNPPGTDAISGGPGSDTVNYDKDYGGHIGALTVTLDDQANDGTGAERDDVGSDVEILYGSIPGDKLVGGPGPNELHGNGGDDVLLGMGGDDKVFGGGGNDDLSGGDGSDFLEGNEDDDSLDGGPGFDSFVGDETGSPNQILTGNDTILARDGVQKEPISCGPGSDTATIDTGDLPVLDPQNLCESVKRGSPQPSAKCAGKKATIVGTAKKNVLKGTKKADVIVGLGGNDVIRGAGGNDLICGGGGADKLFGEGGKDRLLGGGGKDRLVGGPGKDKLDGGPGKDSQQQ